MATSRQQSTASRIALPDEVDTRCSSQTTVPATHRHAIRRILERFDGNTTYDEASMYATDSETRLRLYDVHAFSTYDVRRALQGFQIDWEMSVYADPRHRVTVRLKR